MTFHPILCLLLNQWCLHCLTSASFSLNSKLRRGHTVPPWIPSPSPSAQCSLSYITKLCKTPWIQRTMTGQEGRFAEKLNQIICQQSGTNKQAREGESLRKSVLKGKHSTTLLLWEAEMLMGWNPCRSREDKNVTPFVQKSRKGAGGHRCQWPPRRDTVWMLTWTSSLFLWRACSSNLTICWLQIRTPWG